MIFWLTPKIKQAEEFIELFNICWTLLKFYLSLSFTIFSQLSRVKFNQVNDHELILISEIL